MSNVKVQQQFWTAIAVALLLATTWSAAQTGRDERTTSQPTTRPALVEPKHEPTASEVLEMLSPREDFGQPIVRPNLPGSRRPTTLQPEARPKNAVVPVEPRLKRRRTPTRSE